LEVELQISLGELLTALKGWGSHGAEQAFMRARQLAGKLEDHVSSFIALFGLWSVHHCRANLPQARRLGGELLDIAEGLEATQRVYANHALGETLFHEGEFQTAKHHLETAILIYDSAYDQRSAPRMAGVDGRVWALSYLCWALWYLGYPDRAMEAGKQALSQAQELSQPHSLVFAQMYLVAAHLDRGENRLAEKLARSALANAQNNDISSFALAADLFLAELRATQNDSDCLDQQALQIESILSAMHSAAFHAIDPYIYCILARVYSSAKLFQRASACIMNAGAAACAQCNYYYLPEIERLKGTLILQEKPDQKSEAHSCFRKAVEIARTQSAKSLELRATISLVRLLRDMGRSDEARTILAEIYGWFTEGFNTKDLKEAKELLDELA
jgi:predicted ATPase